MMVTQKAMLLKHNLWFKFWLLRFWYRRLSSSEFKEFMRKHVNFITVCVRHQACDFDYFTHVRNRIFNFGSVLVL